MDYSKLRAAALRDGEDEEAVTVDTRALIDKVLARYSGEWTTLRELIQNAADAQATTVRIKWETLPSTQVPLPQTTNRSELLKHIVANHTLRRLLVSNNGQPFTKTDWGRLKRIAEGNPDETKIGAFGVGFYSVFADCEEPFVSSGNEAMAFYWKGNALFTRKLQLSPDHGSPDTTFVLDYRNSTTPLPNLLSIGQFLATSLTFVALQHIEFWIDDYCILDLRKKTSPNTAVTIPRDLETKTKEGIMQLSTVERTSAQIDATFMSAIGWKPQVASSANRGADYYFNSSNEIPSLRSFFSRLTSTTSQTGVRAKAAREEKAAQDAIAEDLTATSTSSIFLRVTTGSIKTTVSQSFATELERATKKPPPKTTKLAILTSSYDETLASEATAASGAAGKSADVFASVLPSKKPGGRIFIGFPTGQTTGAGMHISAPSVIPTVEREAIDLNARWVRTWNIEMLRVAGIMTRLAFANEMQDLHAKLKALADKNAKGAMTPADVAKFIPEALHILKTYTFGDSTPSGNVGQIIEEAFWTAFRRASIEVYSSRGVLSSSKVRVGSEELAKFVSGIPVVLDEMKDAPFMKKLSDFGLIKQITVDDVCSELGAKALDKDQLLHFIAWAGKAAVTGELDVPDKQRVLDVAVATISEGDGGSGDIIALGTIKNYLNPSKIPANLPIPPTTLPLEFTKSIPLPHLQALGWEALEIVPWLRFIIETRERKGDDFNITKSPAFAVQILTVISKSWDNLSQSSKTSVTSALQNNTVIPTKMGMKKPGDAFFSTVKLFDDLPIIQGCNGIKDKFLAALGIRKTVDLDTIFTRLLSPSAEENGQKKWSHMELIKYLTSVKDDIPPGDMKKLTESKWCPAEAGPAGAEPTKGTTQLYKVSELFEPKDSLRNLKLPILQWIGPPGSFRSSSNEARFLYGLGLRPYPSVPELVDMMASADVQLRRNAMSYFISNHHINNYAQMSLANTNKAILPLQGNEKQLVPPSACYTNDASAVLGFNILSRELHQHAGKFGVARDPPITACVDRLIAKPPQDRRAAITLFEYFTTRIQDLGENSLAKLRDTAIVPVVRKNARDSSLLEKMQTNVIHVRPQQVYLGTSLTYGDIFDFVDFGTDANAFLFKCGAKNEPTKTEIARLACTEPARLLSILQSSEKYLSLLKSLAQETATLKRDKELWKKMKASPFLLGFREIASAKTGSDSYDEDDAPIKQYQLASASQIVVQDDYISFRLFKESLICAPEDDTLEDFYMALGSDCLSRLVQEDVRTGPVMNKPDAVAWLRKHVIERTKLFLYEYAKSQKDFIKHDARWLESNLTIEVVRTLALRRSLRGQGKTHTEKRSAASVRVDKGYVLYINGESAKPDMYEVGIALCQLILSRPSQQAYFFFEPFLKLDLLELRARGYNVDRILRAKAAEARIAEEERRKALEAEQQKIREREQEWAKKGHTAEAARQSPATPEPPVPRKPIMPGSFDDSPEESKPLPPPKEPRGRNKGIFSNLTRRLGLDTGDEPDDHINDFLPEPEHDHQQGKDQSSGGTRAPQDGKRPDDGRVTSPAVVHQNLLNAIKSTRAHDSSKLFSPPTQTEVKEQGTYCDSTPAQNISFAAEAPRGMRVFVSRSVKTDPVALLQQNSSAIAAFESVLVEAGGVYGLSNRVLHIFYDESGGTIAFNSSGSIFCNLRFFVQLHAEAVRTRGAEGRAEAATWWWVVLAHELAHNLVSQHNSEHSYYTESFIQQYFPKMMAKAASWSSPGSSAQQSGSAGGRLEPPPPYRTSASQQPSLLD